MSYVPNWYINVVNLNPLEYPMNFYFWYNSFQFVTGGRNNGMA